MTRLLLLPAVVALSALCALAAEQTWTGKISDSMCGADHSKMAGEHAGAKMSDRDCTLACAKAGAKYVVVSDGRTYNIANQDFASLQQHAGHAVKLTGDMQGDSITRLKRL